MLGVLLLGAAFVLGGIGAALVSARRSSLPVQSWRRVAGYALGVAALIGMFFPKMGCIAVPFWFDAALSLIPGLPLAAIGYAAARPILRRRCS